MSSLAVESSASARPRQATPVPLTATIRSEWTKISTVRSTWIIAIATVVLSVTISALVCWAIGYSWNEWPEDERDSFDPLLMSLAGQLLANVLMVVQAVIPVTNEYGNGMIRLTFMATPRRGRVLASKLIVIALLTNGVGMITTVATIVAGQVVFRLYDVPAVSLADADVLRLLLVSLIVTPVMPMVAVALAFMLRSAAASITTMVLLAFTPYVAGEVVAERWRHNVLAWSPSPAVDSLVIGHLEGASSWLLPAWQGAILMVVWLAVFIGAALYVLNHRDV